MQDMNGLFCVKGERGGEGGMDGNRGWDNEVKAEEREGGVF